MPTEKHPSPTPAPAATIVKAEALVSAAVATAKGTSIFDFMRQNGSMIVTPDGITVWAYSSGKSPVTVSVSYDTGTSKGTVNHTFQP